VSSELWVLEEEEVKNSSLDVIVLIYGSRLYGLGLLFLEL